MIDRKKLMRLQVRALFTHDDNGRLDSVNEVEGREAPQFFLGRTPDGNVWRFRHDLDATTVVELEALCLQVPLGMDTALPQSAIETFASILNRQQPLQRTWAGPAYRFPQIADVEPAAAVRVGPDNADVLRPHLPDWVDVAVSGQLLVAILEQGRAVAVCGSVRVTPDAHEAGVETAASFRGLGYGAAVVSAWARVVTDLGAIPFYSTSWDNVVSQRLARSLSLVQFGSNLHFS
ncbi:MAG: GNAT family N-acetyltransferase [Candidatus Methylomirabilaceae bacterium]